MTGVDCYTIEWPPKPPIRCKLLWANLQRGKHQTFKETSKGRQRHQRRRFTRYVQWLTRA